MKQHTQTLKLYFASLLVFLSIDAIWLTVIARKLYQQQLGHLLTTEVNWIAAAVFYALFVVGVLFFATIPALKKNSLTDAAIKGAVFGLMTYATYDLTNMATLPNWPLYITIIDMIWGSSIAAVTAVAGVFLFKKQ